MTSSRVRRSSGARLRVLGLVTIQMAVVIWPTGTITAAPSVDPIVAEVPVKVSTTTATERPVVDFADRAGPGTAGSTDPSITLRTPSTVTVPPNQVTDVKGLWSEGSRTVANPDGTYTLSTAEGRMNYRDSLGVWQPIDSSLVVEELGPFGFRVNANDRSIRLGADDATSGLGEIRAGSASLTVRSLDFVGPLTSVIPVAEPTASATPAPSASAIPDPSAGPSGAPSPSPGPSTSPDIEPEVTAAPSPAASAATDPAAPDPAASSPVEQTPAPSVAPTTGPSQPAEPTIPPAPASSAPTAPPTPAPSLEPTPGPSGEPIEVPADGIVRFGEADGESQVIVRSTSDGFEFGAVLDGPSAPNVYAFAIDTAGMTASVGADGKTIALAQETRSEGRAEVTAFGVISPPFMLDANNVPGPETAVSVEVYVPGQDSRLPAGVSPGSIASLKASEIVAVYTIDPSYLADPGRAYPVELDPTACLGEGASGCLINGTGKNFDHFVTSGPDNPGSAWDVFRVGRDSLSSDGAAFGTMRGLVYFGDVALPDGAVINDTNLALHISSLHGAPSGAVNVYRITEDWSTTTTWGQFSSGAGYIVSGYAQTTPIPLAGNHMNFDVDAITTSWYTRRGENWKPNLGFLVRLVDEDAGEIMFDRSNDQDDDDFRPKLTITYDLPKVSIGFDPALGANYAPSTMVAGQATTLPIRVTNDGSGFDFTPGPWLVGYRWFDAKGKTVGSGAQALPACVGTGSGCTATTSTFALNVTPPATVGQYTLRLDLKRHGTVDVYASDYAKPSEYYSRNKKSLSAEDTRWIGDSDVERDEFGISVIAGGGDVGEVQSVGTGDGGQLDLNLSSGNLAYTGSGGVGFQDLIPMGLEWRYDSKFANDCGGVLKACGWATNFDERFIPGTAGAYTYQGSSGNRYLADTDASQQLISSAPVLLERRRTTLFDENVPSNPSVAALVQPGFGAFSGRYAVRVPENGGTKAVSGAGTTDLNAYRNLRFAIRTDNLSSAGVGLKISNVTTGFEGWLKYAVGTPWATGGTAQINVSGTVTDSWQYVSRSLYADVQSSGVFGGPRDSYQVIAVQIEMPSSAAAGGVYLDSLRLEGGQTAIADESAVAWTSGSSLATQVTSDVPVGTKAYKIAAGAIGSSPECTGSCMSFTDGGLWNYGFTHWRWKKVGGATAAVVFHLKDLRTPTACPVAPLACDLTYYAGPTPPPGAVNAIQVSDRAPDNWARVDRNLLEDARQVLNMYNDNAGATSPSVPPSQGPTPDDVQFTGYEVSAGDSGFLLFDDFAYGSIPDVGAEQANHPSSSSDATFTYDFAATYRDGSVHQFDNLGLLTRILDRNGNAIGLDWTTPDLNVTGQAGRELDVIRAPFDAKLSGSWTYVRQLDLVRSTTSTTRTVNFTERLGSVSVPVTGRTSGFTMATQVGTGFGVNDLIRIKPARTSGCVATATSGVPNGCVLPRYTDTTAHLLKAVSDPRWDGLATGAADYRFSVTWSGGSPTEIVDESTGAVLLRVVDSNLGAALPAARRLAWQDAAGVSKGMARYADLTSDGNALIDYIPLACAAGNCLTGLPSTASLGTRKLREQTFDGLARVNQSTTYRCPGVAVSGCEDGTPQAVVSRQGTQAGARVDNFADPLTGGQVAWTQSPDQYVASLRDSSGLDRDLYRTAFEYDDNGQQIATTELAENQNADYASAVLTSTSLTGSLKAYYRLGEATGNPTDSAPVANNGTATAIQYSHEGAIVGSIDNSFGFNGSTSKVTSPTPLPQTAYSIVAWVRSTAEQTNKGIAGRYSAASGGAFLWLDASGYYTLVHTSTATNYLHSAVKPRIGSFDQVVGTWTGQTMNLYVNGSLVASQPRGVAPGTGASAFEIGLYGSSGTTTFTGDLDEVALYSQALTSPQVRNQFLAARAVAARTTARLLDGSWRAIQADDQFLSNAGFEAGLADWDFGTSGSGVIYTASTLPDANLHSPIDPALPDGWRSFKTGISGFARQDVQLVPGQTFRFQVWHKRVGTTGQASIKVWYWDSNQWNLTVDGSYTDSAWTGRAWDIPLPVTSDGRVRIALAATGVTGTNSIYFDDAALFTSYGRTTYAAPYGLVTDVLTVSPATSGPIAELKVHSAYTSTSTVPPIFPTSVTANSTGAAFDPDSPDENVTTTVTHDVWGHALVTTDQDGVSSTAEYVASSSSLGYATDVVATRDGLGNETTFAYDEAGNQTTQTSPRQALSSTSYDLRSHPLVVVSPDGKRSKSVYDAAGFLVSTIANQVDDSPSSSAGLDDVVTTFAYDEYGMTTSTTSNTGGSLGSVGSKITTTHDMLGNVVSTIDYSTFNGTTYGGSRTTTAHVERVSSSISVWRPKPSGTRGPLAAAAAPSPDCPDGSGSLCNSVLTLDLHGQAAAVIDAYGKITRQYRDLSGQVVGTVANYVNGTYDVAAPDEDVTTVTQFGLLGHPTVEIDPLERKVVTTYDARGRAVRVTTVDSADNAKTITRTTYTGAGRVKLTSFPGPAGTADALLAWTESRYDDAGRPTESIANVDLDGLAGGWMDAFESGIDGWRSTASGWFTSAGPALKTMGTSNASAWAPSTGNDRLEMPVAATQYSGTWVDLSGPTFVHGHTYRVRADIRSDTAGRTVQAFFGVDASGASYGSSGSQMLTTAWQTLDFSWTPLTDVDTNVHLAIRDPNGGTGSFFIDNVMIWDTAEPDRNIPTETVYDVDGHAVATVTPPGDPATERPLVNTTTLDSMGRQVMVSANAKRQYGPEIQANATLTHYWALDELSGPRADSQGSLTVAASGGPVGGVAGGVDETRAALDFDGVDDYASASSAASTATDNFSLEAWFRNDTNTPFQDIAFNGIDSFGWGIGFDGAGDLAAVYSGAAWLSTGVKPAIDVWHHVALVRNAGTTTIYLDGAALTPTNSTIAPTVPGAGFAIGRQSGATGRYFAGSIDEVAVYSSALSTATVAAHVAAGRPADSVTALTSRTMFDDLGRARSTLDPTRTHTKYTYDRLGRLTATVQNYIDNNPGGSTTSDDVRSRFAYNAAGEMTGYCSAAQVFPGTCDEWSSSNAQAWHYAYDDAGRLALQVPPVNAVLGMTALGTTRWTYDAGGRLSVSCDAVAGSTSCSSGTILGTTTPTYDDVGRPTRVDSTAAGVTIRSDNVYLGDGQLKQTTYYETNLTTPVDTLEFSYDTLGRSTGMTRGGVSLTSMTYNTDGTVATRTDGDGGAIGTSAFGYDWAKRLVSVDLPDTFSTETPTLSWRLDGLIGARTWAAGSAATFGYDAAKRPVSLTKGTLTQAQTFDRDGNVRTESRSFPSVSGDPGTGTQTFNYDALNRITSSTGLASGARSYTYDRNGNRLTKTEGGTTYTYAYDRTDELASVTLTGGASQTYTYDGRGNMTKNGETGLANTLMTYDPANKLKMINASGLANDTTFTYDALGRIRTRATGNTSSPTSTDTYSYVGSGETVARISNSVGPTTTDSIVDPAGNRLGVRVVTPASDTVNWFLPDLHGSIAASLDSTEASITNAIRYDAWGQTIATGAQTGSPAAVGDKPWRYQGRLDISQTALGTPLYDMSARMYSPGSGTFTSLDSVLGSAQNPLSMNRFLYALANPATLIDPTGHAPCAGWDPDCAYLQANALEKTEQNTADTRKEKERERKAESSGDAPRPDHESDPASGPGGPESWIDLASPDAPSEAKMHGEFTLCGINASGNPSSHLACLQKSLGPEFGLYTFGLLGPSEYEARDTDWLLGPASVVAFVAGLLRGKRLPVAVSVGKRLDTTLPIVTGAQVKIELVAEKLGVKPENLVRTVLRNGLRYLDNRVKNAGNIDVLLQRPDSGGFIRVTLDPTGQRVISAGLMPGRQVLGLIKNGGITFIDGK
jgi:RHS repeat-associated protein